MTEGGEGGGKRLAGEERRDGDTEGWNRGIGAVMCVLMGWEVRGTECRLRGETGWVDLGGRGWMGNTALYVPRWTLSGAEKRS